MATLSPGLCLATCSCNSGPEVIFIPSILVMISYFFMPANDAAPFVGTSVTNTPSPSLMLIPNYFS